MAQEQRQPILPLASYRVRYATSGQEQAPHYLGSAVRGAFGHAVKKAVCVTRLPHCEPCLLYRSCPYSYIFETPPPVAAAKMRLYKAAPHPYVFDLPRSGGGHSQNGGLTVGLTLFGHGNQYLPYVLHALKEAGKKGIGSRRIELALESVEQWTGDGGSGWEPIYRPGEALGSKPPTTPGIPQVADQIEIRFETPLRLRRDNANVTPDQFQFADLFTALMRRISMLTYFHTDTPLETDFKTLADRAREIELIDRELEWHDWTRYSSRQKTTMQMGGVVGSIRLHGGALGPFWAYLWLGQWTHAGKGTSMGLGRYTIEAASLRDRTPMGS